MALLTWSSSMEVGIGEIDRQHKKLVDLINTLHEGMLAKKTKEALGKTLAELISYTKSHFGTEEKYFDRFGYPDAAKHKKEHVAFAGKVLDFQKKFEDGSILISMEIMTFLREWLVKHIQGSDKAYGPFLKGKGVV